PRAEQELEARPVADALYHLLAASLLLADGQALLEGKSDAHRLLSGALYLRRWVVSREAGAAPFGPREIEWLHALADFRAVPPRAPASRARARDRRLADQGGVRCDLGSADHHRQIHARLIQLVRGHHRGQEREMDEAPRDMASALVQGVQGGVEGVV